MFCIVRAKWFNDVIFILIILDLYSTAVIDFICRIDRNPASCVESLLTTSSSHSPYFDWVVADVGNAFPNAIIEKVLFSGFDKFCKLRWSK